MKHAYGKDYYCSEVLMIYVLYESQCSKPQKKKKRNETKSHAEEHLEEK